MVASCILTVAATLLFGALALDESLLHRSLKVRSNSESRIHRGLQTDETGSFENFVERFARKYKVGTEEYKLREATFQQRLAAVQLHNAKEDRRWTASLNALSDKTESEFAQMLGWRGGAQPSRKPIQQQSKGHVAFFQSLAKQKMLPSEVSWAYLKTVDNIADQGSCGSCWAVAASRVLQAYTEINKAQRSFSIQHIVSCTPNPQHCGGTGGCEGATAELAFDYVFHHGAPSEEESPYVGRDVACPYTLLESGGTNVNGGSFGMTGWVKLPENKVEPLMWAVSDHGPVAVAVAAGSWGQYGWGVFDGCKKDKVINHAVVLVGYGTDAKAGDFWTIMNSWGSDWGERGLIRLARATGEEEQCGWDKHPEDGSGCDGGPSKVWVCGTCGILYDTAAPVFVQNNLSLMDA